MYYIHDLRPGRFYSVKYSTSKVPSLPGDKVVCLSAEAWPFVATTVHSRNPSLVGTMWHRDRGVGTIFDPCEVEVRQPDHSWDRYAFESRQIERYDPYDYLYDDYCYDDYYCYEEDDLFSAGEDDYLDYPDDFWDQPEPEELIDPVSFFVSASKASRHSRRQNRKLPRDRPSATRKKHKRGNLVWLAIVLKR